MASLSPKAKRAKRSVDDVDNANDENDTDEAGEDGARSVAVSSSSFNRLGDVIALEYRCNITLELPYDPVVAADGRIYEREAIKKWIKHNTKGRNVDNKKVRSPTTNVPMDTGIISLSQVQNTIGACIDAGVITGEMASTWLEKRNKCLENQKKVAALVDGANKGDKDMAHELAMAYEVGNLGLKKCNKASAKWHKVAADAGHPFSACIVGLCHRHGVYGFEENIHVGMAYIFSAALLGSETGCFEVGYAYQVGTWQFPFDHEEAKKWYGRMTSCSSMDATNDDRRQRAKDALLVLSAVS